MSTSNTEKGVVDIRSEGASVGYSYSTKLLLFRDEEDHEPNYPCGL